MQNVAFEISPICPKSPCGANSINYFMSTLGLDPWWVAALAPTVVDTRDAAPRWPVTGHFPGLRRSRIHDPVHTAWQRRRWRWCVQRAISVRAAALTQHGTRCWASVAHTRTRWWVLGRARLLAHSASCKGGGGGNMDGSAVGPPSAPQRRFRALPRLSTTTQSHQPPSAPASSIET